ncbi:MAG TPA: hypothetical protein VGV10_02775 [Thermoleophilaceae bacterium]|nr:hypothetical protein [Thermoleophilaceae bacterium]
MTGTLLLEGTSWEALAADQRPHRLKAGKHFRGDVRALQGEAGDAAQRLGLVVRTLRDEFGRKNRYVWVQFADAVVPRGEPCPRCSSRHLRRVHEHYVRCRDCGAHLVLTPPLPAPEEEQGAEGSPHLPKWARTPHRDRLSGYSELELVPDEDSRIPQGEIWYGRAVDENGTPVFLEVLYPRREGQRIEDPEREGEPLHRVRRWPMAMFWRAAELGLLDDLPRER